MTNRIEVLDTETEESSAQSRRDFVRNTSVLAVGGVAGMAALGAGVAPAPAMAAPSRKEATSVALDWKEVY